MTEEQEKLIKAFYFVNGHIFIAEVHDALDENSICIINPVMVNITPQGLNFANPFPITDFDVEIYINANTLVTSTVVTEAQIKKSYSDIVVQMKAQKAGLVPANAPVPTQEVSKIIKG